MTSERDRRERRGERNVVRDADGRVDDVADELRLGAAGEQRRDVVAERQREGEDRAGDDAGQRERQDDAAERREAAARRDRATPRGSEWGIRSSAA